MMSYATANLDIDKSILIALRLQMNYKRMFYMKLTRLNDIMADSMYLKKQRYIHITSYMQLKNCYKTTR